MSLNVLTQGGGAGGEFASIFVTGLDENSTVTAAKGSKTLRGKWVQKKNPAYVVPDGYTQFEYIQSTGTQYLNSKIIPSASTGVRVKTMPLTANTGTVLGAITGIGAGYFGITSYQSMWDAYWGASTGAKGNIGVNTWSELRLNYMNDKQFTDDGVLLTSLGSATITTNPVHIFRMNPGTYSDPQYYVGRIAELEFTVGTEITNRFVPAKRNSDGAIGMIDIVTGVFESNAGTGTFIAGAEVPQYVYGFEIAPIKEYGMYTVTATDGEQTATQDVLVDAAVEYEIEMSYVLWLYREGDECEDVTGGYSKCPIGSTTNTTAPTKESDRLSFTSGYYPNLCTNNAIDVTSYTRLFAEIQATGTNKWHPWVGIFTARNIDGNYRNALIAVGQDGDGTANKQVISCDITSITGQKYIGVASTGDGGTGYVYNIWLE